MDLNIQDLDHFFSLDLSSGSRSFFSDRLPTMDIPDDLLPEAPPVLDPEDGGGERPREAAHVLVPLPLLLGREVAHRRRRGHVGVQPLASTVLVVVVSPVK